LLVGGAVAASAVAAITALIFPLREISPAESTGVAYLVAVLLVSTIWGLRLGLRTSVASAAAFNFFHLPPTGRFTIAEGRHWVALGTFPFAGGALSRRALDAALRLALAEGATLVPVFLARVPMEMPLDIPLPRQCTEGMPLLETIEQRAARLGVPVDARIERGRTFRHALREAILNERFDRIVVAAASLRSAGFHGDDIAWLPDNAPGEVVIIRPGRDDQFDAGGSRRRRASEQPESGRTHSRDARPAGVGGGVG
jgi:nucleotide-binding universal stress UspA family protein